jgi:urease subunit beta
VKNPYIPAQDPIEINPGRPVTTLTIRNIGDRPVQVGSHYHFFEANRELDFDRAQAFGKHLNIPAGASIRLEPGDEKEVELVPFGGKGVLCGFAGFVNGSVHADGAAEAASEAARRAGFKGA